jgi:putative MFS transporter
MMIGFQLLQTVGVYGWANWLPTFLVQQGIPLVTSLRYSLLMAVASPTRSARRGVVLGSAGEKVDHRDALRRDGLSPGWSFCRQRAPWQVIACGATLTMLSYWFSAAFHAYQAELFPTRARATGLASRTAGVG